MSDQPTEELQSQAQAMLGYLGQVLANANTTIVNLVGEKAISDLRLKNALARIAELEPKPAKTPVPEVPSGEA